jgi:6-phospho-beta-glucosidase
MRGICEYAIREAITRSYVNPASLVSWHTELEAAVGGATHIVCQVRAGGMKGRARDERAALSAGVPGDEGIGPGGLSAFVRGRSTMRQILDRCARAAPHAVFLQLSGPLGLMTALAREHYPKSSFGVCELPITVAARILKSVGPRIGGGPFSHSVMGVNHCSWLHNFVDLDGIDRTREFVADVDSQAILGIAPAVVRQCEAIPMPYLRLLFHRDEVMREQERRAMTRGEELDGWTRRLDEAYSRPSGVNADEVRSLLAQRRIDWYEEGVVPVLSALFGNEPVLLPLDLPNEGTLRGVSRDAIIETMVSIERGQATPLNAPPLPDLPDRLTRAFLEYERRALALPGTPSVDDLRDVLSTHPLVTQSELDAAAASCAAAAEDRTAA